LPAVPASVQLVPGGNNVIYFGEERGVETVAGLVPAQLLRAQAFAQTQGSSIERIWRLDFNDAAMPWRLWAPILPDALQGFEIVEYGRVYFVIASEALT